MRLASSSGSVSPAKARWLVIDTLKGVGGASFHRLPLAVAACSGVRARRSAQDLRALLTRVLASGHSRPPIMRTWRTVLDAAAPSSSATPSWYWWLRRTRGGLTARGIGVMSSMALPSATPAWPSMAAWCTLV